MLEYLEDRSIAESAWECKKNLRLGEARAFQTLENKKAYAKTAYAFLHLMAGTTGFEPAFSTLTGLHVRPLHHVPKFGDPSGIRTRDLYLERVASWAARRWGLCSKQREAL